MSRSRRGPLLLTATLLAGLAAGAQGQPLLAPLTDGTELSLPELDPSVPSPTHRLGYSLGDRFTRHHQILDYLEALAAASPRVRTWSYGETYEGRPLSLVAISTPSNLERLEAIEAQRTGFTEPGRLDQAARRALADEAPAVVWLGYGVHGNESSSAEAALATAYLLAAGRGEGAVELDSLVILIDPLVNPDGRERYVQGFEARRGRVPNPDPLASEHSEPWPGGRGNHYLVDLNRDWAWMSQRETQARIAAFRHWEPQVYVDFHEMGHGATYFFPPAAEPIHPQIGTRARAWLELFGAGNAAAFDRLGWTYYVGEEFDLFYPGYGDSYPALRGGIGMTYEVAGHGRAGTVVERPDGSVLTLADRIARHVTTSLATVDTAREHARTLVSGFLSNRLEALDRPGPTYFWKESQPESIALARLLAAHGIEVGRLPSRTSLTARALATGESREIELQAGDFMVSTRQPLGTLARALLEREAAMPASFLAEQRRRADDHLSPSFFDVTAWSLPLAFGLEAWWTDGPPPESTAPLDAPPPATPGRAGVGYLVPPQGLAGYRFTAALARERIPHRLALESLRVAEREFPSGTLFVPRVEGSRATDAVDERLRSLARDQGVELVAVDSSSTRRGLRLGSDRFVSVRPSRIALVGGPGTEPSSFGPIWHLLDRQLEAEHSVLFTDDLADVQLSGFDCIVLPSGRYGNLGEGDAKRLAAWAEQGGLLVALGDAADWLAEHEVVTLETSSEENGSEAPDAVWDTQRIVPGAIVALQLVDHPLTTGLASPLAGLFWGDTFYRLSGDPQRDLARVRSQDPVVAGFAWAEGREALADSLVVSYQPQGSGAIVLLTQDPVFRLFWRGTAPLLLNPILFGPSW